MTTSLSEPTSTSLPRAQKLVVDTARSSRSKVPVPVLVATGYVLLLAVAALVPGLLGAGDPTLTDPTRALQGPGPDSVFGTDQLGRDVFSRVVAGTRWSLGIAVVALAFGLVVGTLLGLVAGLLPGIVDELLGRLFDLLSAFPGVLLALLVAVLWGRGPVGIALAIGISSVPKFARIIRSRTMQVASSDYVTNAVIFGHSRARNVVRHVLPNVLGSIGLIAAMDLGASIMAISGLSFLQMGPQPPTPEWGVMVAEGRDVLRVAWWPSFFPGLAIVLAVAASMVIGRHAQSRFERRAS